MSRGGMDLRWLTAPEAEVAAAMATLRKDQRPAWMPTRRQVLVHVNHCLMLWYLCIAWMVLGVRIDTLQDNRITAADIRDVSVVLVVFAFWCAGAVWLHRWSKLPPSPRARLKQWRQTLTALANGFDPNPPPARPFSSVITSGPDRGRFFPRFAAEGIEFGNLHHDRRNAGEWRYLVADLPVPVPHLLFEPTARGAGHGRLPVGLPRSRRLGLEGDFDRSFRLYVPQGYEPDALYVITPDLMAAFVDHADAFTIELVDDRIVFYAPEPADFAAPAAWQQVGSLLHGVVPEVVAQAGGYRDERVGGPAPLIDRTGRRLDVRDRRRGVAQTLGAIGWMAALAFLYLVPGLFAFAGIMSIVDGR